MDHVVELGHFVVGICNYRKIQCGALRLANVFSPTAMRVGLIDAKADHFYAAPIKLGFQPRGFAKFSGPNRSEIFGMRTQYRPTITDPVVKVNRASCCLRCEIRSNIT